MSATRNTVRVSSAMRKFFIGAIVLVAMAAFPLFILSTQTDQFFAWTIQPPLTAAFLGAGYWAVTLAVVLALRENEWTYVRIVLPVLATGVTLILLATLLHLDRFHLNSPIFFAQAEAWGWLVLYIGLIPALIWAYMNQRREQGSDVPVKRPLSRWLRLSMGILGTVMLLIGLGLCILPVQVAGIWAWTLTPLTGRMVGAWLAAIGVSLLVGVRENAYERVYVAAAAYVAYAVLQAVNLLRFPETVIWTQPQLWLLIAILVGLLVCGTAILMGYRAVKNAL